MAPVTHLRRLIALLAAQKDDLSFFALVQIPLLAVNVLAAKLLATRHAYPDAPLGAFLSALRRSSSRGTSACSRSLPS